MMKRNWVIKIGLGLCMAAWLAWPGGLVSAHGHVEAGDYELGIGFAVEPAYQGMPNGLELVVTDTRTDTPVSGLEQTLSVEIFYGGASRVLELSPVFGEEGAYTAVIIPSEEGDYTWRIFGEIEGTPVDVSLTSGPDTFSPVINFEGEAFPGDTLTSGQLGKAVDQARSLANISLVIGSVGLILGLAALAISLRRQARTPTTGK